jgi:protein SCO1/2
MDGPKRRSGRLAAPLAAALALIAAPPADGHVRETPDNILASVGVEERLGAAVPTELLFRDQEGTVAPLSARMAGGPVILTLNYFTCPMLCPITLRNLLAAVRKAPGISLDRDFRVLTVSIDPEERPQAARDRARELYSEMTGIRNPKERWPFLTGGGAEIKGLAEAVGFRYAKSGAEFAHPDVAVVLTPDGRVSRYLYGIDPSPRDVRLALVEAAGGRIGASEAANHVLLFCYRYDPVERKYALYARNIMKAGGIFTLVFLGGLYVVLWKRRFAKAKPSGTGDH